MRLKSKIDNKIYLVHTFETYGDRLGLEYVTEDGSECKFFSIGVNGGRTSYDSLNQILKYWEDVE